MIMAESLDSWRGLTRARLDIFTFFSFIKRAVLTVLTVRLIFEIMLERDDAFEDDDPFEEDGSFSFTSTNSTAAEVVVAAVVVVVVVVAASAAAAEAAEAAEPPSSAFFSSSTISIVNVDFRLG